ncbi:hypothetical protein N8T08_000956 [Aspergillus melleus]|uniref:Uncharacterized protein n=1 Tax=Aspergillus melleus TaxID=138277 RepID=A0ACC3BBA2_9EURO|nr:hypothetical protein N8T08_000956 [Aspergillus melleus]
MDLIIVNHWLTNSIVSRFGAGSICAGHLATANIKEDPQRRGLSGSQWGANETNAVRAIPLIGLSPDRIIPKKWFPSDDNEVFALLKKSIRAAEVDDLKAFDGRKFAGNLYQGLRALWALARG